MSRLVLCLSAVCGVAVCVPVSRAQCGDPPDNLDCFTARELPGYPGTHEAEVDVTTAFVIGSEPTPQCGFNVGHTVWFKVTPVVDGSITFSTCHPTTSYDTVVQAYTGDCSGFLFGPVEWCSDDFAGAGCTNVCYPSAPRSSTVTVSDAVAGGTYYFQVGSFNDNSAGCALCLGVYVTIVDRCENELTPPIATLSAPPALGAGCTCLPVDVVGTAGDPDGTFESYRLEYANAAGGAWTLIQSGTNPVSNGVLGTWSHFGGSGYHLLRLTARNTCGMETTAVRAVYVDAGFDTLDFRYPPASAPLAIVGGRVCFEGTVADSWCFNTAAAEYRPAAGGAFLPADPNMNPNTGAVNETIATWDTQRLGLPDGDYELRLAGMTDCGNGAAATRFVTLDNTPPTALIAEPLACDPADGVLQIIGTADDAHLDAWHLQVTGGPYASWTLVNSGATPVVAGVLATWDTSSLPACAYTLRLVVYDRAVLGCASPIRQASEHFVSVNVGTCPGDLDGDRVVGLPDLAALLAVYGSMCP